MPDTEANQEEYPQPGRPNPNTDSAGELL